MAPPIKPKDRVVSESRQKQIEQRLLRIQEFMKYSGKSGTEIAKASGVSRQTVSRIKNWLVGHELAAGEAALAAISEALGVPYGELDVDPLEALDFERLLRAVEAANEAVSHLGDDASNESLRIELVKKIYKETAKKDD